MDNTPTWIFCCFCDFLSFSVHHFNRTAYKIKFWLSTLIQLLELESKILNILCGEPKASCTKLKVQEKKRQRKTTSFPLPILTKSSIDQNACKCITISWQSWYSWTCKKNQERIESYQEKERKWHSSTSQPRSVLLSLITWQRVNQSAC